MKTLTLALLIPVAICTTACGSSGELSAAPAPAAADATDQTRAAGAAPARANAPASGATPELQTTAQVSLTAATGSSAKGDLTLTAEGYAVLIRGEITGLTPGEEHGFHVHEVGQCSLPDFTSAGAHLNPTSDAHGGPESDAKHLGDLPNAKADENGRATIDVTVDGATLVDKDGGPNQLVGRALVVHAMPDDFKTQPSGGSGARIACGVIR